MRVVVKENGSNLNAFNVWLLSQSSNYGKKTRLQLSLWKLELSSLTEWSLNKQSMTEPRKATKLSELRTKIDSDQTDGRDTWRKISQQGKTTSSIYSSWSIWNGLHGTLEPKTTRESSRHADKWSTDILITHTQCCQVLSKLFTE